MPECLWPVVASCLLLHGFAWVDSKNMLGLMAQRQIVDRVGEKVDLWINDLMLLKPHVKTGDLALLE